ncbi:hypothetical protein [Halobacteriovorax sp. ZH5_bin.2]|uniref:hypothetical protein n=1 Tax=Halobacteriovorax sp. ZH5_bin.2 TaxID=3157727 RepID=UPI00371DC0E2
MGLVLKQFQLLFLVLSFLLVSCQQTQRSISSIEDQVDNQPALYLNTITEASDLFDRNLEELVAHYNVNLQKRVYDSSETRAVLISLESMELPEGQAFAIDTAIEDNGVHVLKVIRSTNDAAITKSSKSLLFNFLSEINEKKNIVNIYSFFEIAHNAKAGDLRAKIALENIKMKALGDSAIYDEDRKIIEEGISELESDFKVVKKEMKAKETARKSAMAALDKAAENHQLKALIQNNDRKGVADLLEKYLPWEQMTPIEDSYWNHILNRMRNPIPAKDKVLVYRGTYGDRLFPQIVDGQELEYEDAVKKANLGSMSTILTRNQGTYNRRLRSLQTMYGKKIASNPSNTDSKFVETARLTTMLKQHSIEAQGSPFLSFTSNFDTGYTFGFSIADDKTVADAKGAMGAFLIDPELLMFNQMSGFKSEMEYLAPLITFPDEMVGFYDEDYMEKVNRSAIKDALHDGLKKEMIRIYGDTQGPEIAEEILSRSSEFNEYEKAYLVPKLKTNLTGATNENVGIAKKISNFFSNLKNKFSSSSKGKVKVIDEMPKINNCLYAIKSFLQ